MIPSIWIVQSTTYLVRIKGQALASMPGFVCESAILSKMSYPDTRCQAEAKKAKEYFYLTPHLNTHLLVSHYHTVVLAFHLFLCLPLQRWQGNANNTQLFGTFSLNLLKELATIYWVICSERKVRPQGNYN